MSRMPLHLVATCALGLEEFLVTELTQLGAGRVKAERAAVSFAGSWRDVMRANLRLRTANRVLVELGGWAAASDEALEAGAAALVGGSRNWGGVPAGELFHPKRSFAIRATSSASKLTDRRWVALKVKDGLVDAQRKRFGQRADVERNEPDLQLRVRLHQDRATLLLDTSGDPLDRRGYRLENVAAPLREQLAAACVLAAEWDGRGPVVDPMCGTGTLLAEAAGYALGLAPGRLRESWAFERLPGFERAEWKAVQAETVPRPPREGTDLRLFGVDISRDAVQAARKNLETAGLGNRAEIRPGDAYDYEPPAGPGLLLINPPYGERLEASRDEWRRLGDLMKQRYSGYTAVVIAGGPGLGKQIGLKPRRRIPAYNGPIEVRILPFDLY